jgi:hypothetical protein
MASTYERWETYSTGYDPIRSPLKHGQMLSRLCNFRDNLRRRCSIPNYSNLFSSNWLRPVPASRMHDCAFKILQSPNFWIVRGVQLADSGYKIGRFDGVVLSKFGSFPSRHFHIREPFFAFLLPSGFFDYRVEANVAI